MVEESTGMTINAEGSKRNVSSINHPPESFGDDERGGGIGRVSGPGIGS